MASCLEMKGSEPFTHDAALPEFAAAFRPVLSNDGQSTLAFFPENVSNIEHSEYLRSLRMHHADFRQSATNGDHHENAGCMALYDDNEATMSVRPVMPDLFLYRFV